MVFIVIVGVDFMVDVICQNEVVFYCCGISDGIVLKVYDEKFLFQFLM